VDAASFPDSSGYRLEVYVRIPPATVSALAHLEGETGKLRLTAKLRDPYGTTHNATQEFDVVPEDSSGGLGRVVLLKFPVKPGSHRLQVRVEDLLSQKHGLKYMFHPERESATVEDRVEVPGPSAGRDLSSIEFVWSADSASTPGPFARAGRRVVPNPERLYGVYATDLRVFFSARSRATDRPWHWAARLLDDLGQVVAVRESAAAGSEWLHESSSFDISQEPAGGYDVELKAWQEGDSTVLTRRAHASVAWRSESWLRNPSDVQDEVHFLLSEDAEETFARLHPGEQERYMDDFWRRRDPTPETAVNEARDEFLRRVDTANKNFGRGDIIHGIFSDQGRVFVRYGQPSEILHQVIPTGDNTLAEMIKDLAMSEDRPLGDIGQKGPGADMRPFEVWIYEGDIPLPPDADPAIGHRVLKHRLLFLFVDDHGIGDFRLRYSNE
jgi:GWxTD domain-containing protein